MPKEFHTISLTTHQSRNKCSLAPKSVCFTNSQISSPLRLNNGKLILPQSSQKPANTNTNNKALTNNRSSQQLNACHNPSQPHQKRTQAQRRKLELRKSHNRNCTPLNAPLQDIKPYTRHPHSLHEHHNFIALSSLSPLSLLPLRPLCVYLLFSLLRYLNSEPKPKLASKQTTGPKQNFRLTAGTEWRSSTSSKAKLTSYRPPSCFAPSLRTQEQRRWSSPETPPHSSPSSLSLSISPLLFSKFSAALFSRVHFHSLCLPSPARTLASPVSELSCALCRLPLRAMASVKLQLQGLLCNR